MDKKPERFPRDPVVITGIGVEAHEVVVSGHQCGDRQHLNLDLSHDCRPLEFLRQRKTLKFMSKQDRLAVNAAGQAIISSALTAEDLKNDTGVFLTVGYIPFEFDIADELSSNSTDPSGSFSMEKFSTSGIDNINPLIAFACLPNMPAHHIATNFGIHGEYFITYPDIIQQYLSLEEALWHLEEERTTFALVGGVADQSNFLVTHHYKKTNPAIVDRLADAAAFMVIEKESSAKSRKAKILATLDHLHIAHLSSSEHQCGNDKNYESGPAQLVSKLSGFINSDTRNFRHILGDTYSSWVKHG